MKLLLLGATGLVGAHLLELALADERVTSVVAPVRRPLKSHHKLYAPVIDFENLSENGDIWTADAGVCVLGSTMKKAGSQDAFYHVDYELPMNAARLAQENHTPVWVLNSAAGACRQSHFFYNRVKGHLESDLASLNFNSLTIVKPGIISGCRKEFRPGEKALVVGLNLISPFIGKRWRPVSAVNIAKALLEAAINPSLGNNVVLSEQML